MLRALLRASDPGTMRADAEFAVAEEPEWSVRRDIALRELAEAHLREGDLGEARRCFAESTAQAAAVGNVEPAIVSESELAVLTMDRGDWIRPPTTCRSHST
ncbi:hypothetical protein [Jiangella muralis]|uniref:hypothetical protein n=1 Tax=Jiangella muralis TaxID=702383 RepID=UPI00069F5CA9|nr:hypothetical protein [Jiangella muralis]